MIRNILVYIVSHTFTIYSIVYISIVCVLHPINLKADVCNEYTTGASDSIPSSLTMFTSLISNSQISPDILYKTPEASAFMKYGHERINNFTGQANIQIPIYEATDRDINIPINLRYDSQGIKVAQEASWVGLGWDLNVGGCVNVIPAGSYDYTLPEASWTSYRNLLNYSSFAS